MQTSDKPLKSQIMYRLNHERHKKQLLNVVPTSNRELFCKVLQMGRKKSYKNANLTLYTESTLRAFGMDSSLLHLPEKIFSLNYHKHLEMDAAALGNNWWL